MVKFYDLVTEYRNEKERWENINEKLRQAIEMYLSEWTDCKMKEISDLNFSFGKTELSVYVMNVYGCYITYIIPYDYKVEEV